MPGTAPSPSATRSSASSPAARRGGLSSTPSCSSESGRPRSGLSAKRTSGGGLEEPRGSPSAAEAAGRAPTLSSLSQGRTYEDAGVSLQKAEAVVERLRAAVESTGARGFGGFAGLHPLGDGRFLAATTDSVGSKLMLARRAGRLRTAGADLAAHCINDVACVGAEPLILLDYVAANRIDLEQVTELVEGAATVCRAAGVALIGGETAELPGIYQEEELDFVGTCVGIATDVIDGTHCERGDAIVGFASNGLHTNGYTLVRELVGDGDFDADLLLAPHRLYLDDVRALRGRADVRALAHITGGGVLGNLKRVTNGLEPHIDWDAWERPPVYAWLTEQGVDEEEQRRVFNCGIGLCAVVPRSDVGDALVIGELA
jgi:phosphoribosylformylglycinamidine cyclo-ligase